MKRTNEPTQQQPRDALDLISDDDLAGDMHAMSDEEAKKTLAAYGLNEDDARAMMNAIVVEASSALAEKGAKEQGAKRPVVVVPQDDHASANHRRDASIIPRRRTRWVGFALAATVILALGGGSAVYAWSRRNFDERLAQPSGTVPSSTLTGAVPPPPPPPSECQTLAGWDDAGRSAAPAAFEGIVGRRGDDAAKLFIALDKPVCTAEGEPVSEMQVSAQGIDLTSFVGKHTRVEGTPLRVGASEDPEGNNNDRPLALAAKKASLLP